MDSDKVIKESATAAASNLYCRSTTMALVGQSGRVMDVVFNGGSGQVRSKPQWVGLDEVKKM